MKVLVDMSLSPAWAEYLTANGIEAAVHWSQIGDPRAKDEVLLRWALVHGHVVFTHDLDFSALLARAAASGPSLLQIRAYDVLPETLGSVILQVLREQSTALADGAIVTVDTMAARVRILPIRRSR